MSVNIEHALITAITCSGDFQSVDRAQIDESYFTSPDIREVFRFLRDTYRAPETNGLVPSLDMVRFRFPGFYPTQVYDAVPILCAHMREERIRMELLALSQSLQDLAEKDPQAAMAELRGEVAKISSLATVGEDLSMSSAYDMILQQYETVQNSGGMLGIPYPWAPMNEETQGMQRGQFIVYYGRPKSMKTWVASYVGCHAYVHSRRRVLFYTREMTPQLLALRCAAIIAGVDYKAFKNGTLQPEMKAHVFNILRELIDDEKAAGAAGYRQPYLIITTDRSARMSGQGGGVTWLRTKIRDLDPDLVIVDGMYLMRDDRSNQRTVDWKAIAHISQDLKLTAQEFDIPLIGVTQANRAADKAKGEDLTELAFSDSLGQDADAVFRVSKKTVVDEATKQKKTELYINAPGLREGVFDGIVVNGQPATSFDYVRTLTAAAEEGEEGDDYGERGRRGGGGGGSEGGVRPTFQRRPQSFTDPKITVRR